MSSQNAGRFRGAALALLACAATPNLALAEEETVTAPSDEVTKGDDAVSAQESAPEVEAEHTMPLTPPAVGNTTFSGHSYDEPTFRAETTRYTFPNVPLLATGATFFTASYVPAVIGGAVSDRDDDDLYVPVAGPWLTYANGPDETAGQKALLAINGAVQGVSALAMVASFFIPQTRTQNWYLIGSSDVRLTPTAGGGSYGLSASGRF